MTRVEAIILETLSFFDPLTLEQIILQMDEESCKELGDMDTDELLAVLKSLEKEGKIKKLSHRDEYGWQRLLESERPKGVFGRILSAYRNLKKS